MRKIVRTIFIFILLFAIAFFTLINADIQVLHTGKKHIIADVSELKPAQSILVPGAAVWRGGTLSPVLRDRMQTALEIYRHGKAQKILLSGDHGRRSYDEVNAMRKFLLARGVPPQNIFLDHAGFRTYDSIVRARKIFRVDSAIVVTQKFHLPRALFLAKRNGIAAQGFPADRRIYLYARRYNLREHAARALAFFDALIHRQPKYLGKPIPIKGDGRTTWD